MSGSTIGGVVGGTIGFAVTGGNPVGARWGFMIGSAIGAYVDPVQVKGPRLTDAMSQTSTIGGAIPFGYGRYVTGGNIIWCDRLIEHVKRQRQGKGASSKTTTYTYTRSYAVGVCQGEIFGFHWIKRNGKKVYTSDPAATAEEKAYSAKWLRKVSLHRGGESQMPDSTIVAVEGAGNVSPFRGLAYIVVENDDLTDLSGAVPQYEFCVIATPPEAYLTSKPYPQLSGESQSYEVSPLGMSLRSMVIDGGTYGEASSYEVIPGEIKLKDSYNATYTDGEVVAVSAAPRELVLQRVLVSIDAGQSEAVGVHADPQLIELRAALVTIAALAKESTTVRVEPIGISLT